jgi:DNA polymerase delta subunit 1
MFGITHG